MKGKLLDREVLKHVTNDENEVLVVEITEAKVRDAAFSMHPDKASASMDLSRLLPSFLGVLLGLI